MAYRGSRRSITEGAEGGRQHHIPPLGCQVERSVYSSTPHLKESILGSLLRLAGRAGHACATWVKTWAGEELGWHPEASKVPGATRD